MSFADGQFFSLCDNMANAQTLRGFFYSDNLYLFDKHHICSLDGEKMEGCHTPEDVMAYCKFILNH